MTTPKSSCRFRSWALLGGITFVALALRLYHLDARTVWLDETQCWDNTQAAWPDFIRVVVLNEQTPPLYFAIMKLWTWVFGDGASALRLPSVLFGTATVPLLGALVWRLKGLGAGCCAAMLLAVAPFHIDYSQEARPYTLFPLVVLAATAALAWALDKYSDAAPASRGRAKAWALFALFTLLACLTHYFAIFFIAAQGLVVAAFCLERRNWRPMLHGLLALTAVAVVYAPWLPFLPHHKWVKTAWLGDLLGQWDVFSQLWIAATTVLFGRTFPHPLQEDIPNTMLLLPPLALALRFRPGTSPQDRFALTLLGIMAVMPVLLAWIVSQFRPCLVGRYVIPILPPALGLIAVALWQIPWGWLRWALAGALAGYLLLCLSNEQAGDFSRPDLRGVADYMRERVRPGDAILVDPWHQEGPLTYYLRDRMPLALTGTRDNLDAKLGVDDVERMIRHHERVWLVRLYQNRSPLEEQLDRKFASVYATSEFWMVPMVKMYCASGCPQP